MIKMLCGQFSDEAVTIELLHTVSSVCLEYNIVWHIFASYNGIFSYSKWMWENVKTEYNSKLANPVAIYDLLSTDYFEIIKNINLFGMHCKFWLMPIISFVMADNQ